jgi:SPW repeat-containing protein
VIVGCGEALIDMSPNEDGTHRAAPGGGPFNTARALAPLEVPTAFLSPWLFGFTAVSALAWSAWIVTILIVLAVGSLFVIRSRRATA